MNDRLLLQAGFAPDDLAVEETRHIGGRGPEPMTPDEQEKMNELCNQIQEEQNPDEFTRLIRELAELLEPKQDRLSPERKTEPN